MTRALLRGLSLFKTLPDTELEWLGERLSEACLLAGELLLREGEEGDSFWIVKQGEIEIVRGLETRAPEILAVCGPGAIVGEFALLSADARRTASVRALTEVTVHEVTRPTFDALLHRNPLLAYPMLRHLASGLHEAHARALHDLLAAQDEVVAKRSMERELAIAHDIQMRMIPRAAPHAPGFDFGARLVPMTHVGGDFYDFLDLTDGRIGIVVGDVSGHGVPAALIVSVAMALIRMEAERCLSPAEVLRCVNRQIKRLSGGESFVTVFFAILDRATSRLFCARAGHEPPLLLDGATLHYVQMEGGPVLGLHEDVVCQDHELALKAGANLVLYTDGVTEARNAQRAFFGEHGLMHAARESAHLNAQGLCDAILEAVATHTAGAPTQDDMTVVCLKVGKI